MKRRNTATTTFNVSSVGKLFTQVAVAQLVAAGKLSPDSTISAYWPDYPDPVATRKVTIRHLLTHRSGIDGNIFRNPLTLRSNHDNVPNATGNPLAFEPGSQQQYSNAGYVVPGEIIERVSHDPYAEYIRRHVFAPTGMTASGPVDVRVRGPRIIRRGPGEASAGPPDAPHGPITEELPDTPIGRAAKDYLRAFASGDTAVMRAFIQEHMVPGGRTLSEHVNASAHGSFTTGTV